ncbi:hypothetical protein CPB86DRAFT_816509 [Serendipita vermifera]|nr:hypothetical protein CPB86DRAFT_816509 [Serendipita vermifera]
MALSVATTHTWQLDLATDSNSHTMDSSSNGPSRGAQDTTEASTPTVGTQPGSSLGHGQPTGNQLYHTGGAFSAPVSQWTPSPNAAPFYPQFTPFFNPATPPIAPQPQYFDPNQQIAWAYQQMMMQQAALAQQHHQNQFNQAMAELGRVRANSGPQQNDFFPPTSHQPPMIPGFPFQSGTPPAHPGYNGPSQSFRRGPHGQHHLPGARSNTFDSQDWSRLHAQNIPVPYARPDAAGSSHSVNSSTGSAQVSQGSGTRQRTNSNNTNNSQTTSNSIRGHGSSPARGATVPQLTTDFERTRQPHNRHNSSGTSSPITNTRSPHQRNISTTSDRTTHSSKGQSSTNSPSTANPNTNLSASSAPSTSATPPGGNSPLSRANQRGPAKPSPLSQQQNFTDTAATKRVKRLSKDDSELSPPTVVASALSARQSSLKGRFKRALAFNPPSAVDEHADGGSSIGHGEPTLNGNPGLTVNSDSASSPITPVTAGESIRSTKPKSRAAGLFSGKFNASTDNISLSSTVSSASVMIRKLGSIGKLARRNSLMNITGIFKDKNKDKGEGTSKKSKKADKAEPTVSHVVAEIDRGEMEDESLSGLTPAARVARQHTLKSNAEAARRLREQAAIAASAPASQRNAPGKVPEPWEKNTTTRRAENSSRGVSEDGTLAEDHSDGSGEGGYDPQFDPDATVRLTGLPDLEEEEDVDEPWAVGLRRSIERTRQPGKPVIKNHVGYVQEQHLDPPNAPFAARIRSNSYQTVSESQPGPLAHLPPPDPEQIDGLQRSNSTSNTPEKKAFSLPAFNFEIGGGLDLESKGDDDNKALDTLSSTPGALANAADKPPTFAYAHPTANSSAPALSTMFSGNSGQGNTSTTTNSLTGIKKNISFAATLSIYDTFSGTVYDRRSEPSTANRLTPALAQRIKEELNSFKMEEMEVHHASRIHTHFFV